MTQEERTLWESHPFIWKYFYWIFLAYIFFLIVLIASIWVTILWVVSLIAFAVLAVPLLIQFYRWKSLYYVITEKRIIIRMGIFNVKETNIMVEKIENFEVHRTLVDRIFNTGDIMFLTEGEATEGGIYDVPKIRQVEKIITDLLSRSGE